MAHEPLVTVALIIIVILSSAVGIAGLWFGLAVSHGGFGIVLLAWQLVAAAISCVHHAADHGCDAVDLLRPQTAARGRRSGGAIELVAAGLSSAVPCHGGRGWH